MASTSSTSALADWDSAPNILDGADVEMTAEQCDLEFWLTNVAQGSLRGKPYGRDPAHGVPDFLREAGPLRDSLIEEMAFRALSEDAATQACAYITAAAETLEGREFYATQTLDEARHAQSFRHHLVDVGVPEEELEMTVERVAGASRDGILAPLWEWGLPAFDGSFINGVVIVTVLLEGVLAPTTELSERKWKPISPATEDIERGACVDEIRHLAVGSWFVRQHLEENPEDTERVVTLLLEGSQRWSELPTLEVLQTREALFQEGLEEHGHHFGDAELMPGRRLVDTTAEERIDVALSWSAEVQQRRMRYMGLQDAIMERSTPQEEAPQEEARFTRSEAAAVHE